MRTPAVLAALPVAVSLSLAAVALSLSVSDVHAQPGRPMPKYVTPTEPVKPRWNELTPQQREALAPLEAEWDKLDEVRKRKWLEVAPRYHQLSPEAQQRMHARMREYAKLTPEQRWTARENIQRAYELPADQRNSLIQQYKELPPERKQQLNESARTRRDAARRADRERGERKPKPRRPDPAAK